MATREFPMSLSSYHQKEIKLHCDLPTPVSNPFLEKIKILPKETSSKAGIILSISALKIILNLPKNNSVFQTILFHFSSKLNIGRKVEFVYLSESKNHKTLQHATHH